MKDITIINGPKSNNNNDRVQPRTFYLKEDPDILDLIEKHNNSWPDIYEQLSSIDSGEFC